MLEESHLTRHVIAAAIRVHRALGPGFIEGIYENALAVELNASGILFTRQQPLQISYRGIIVGEHRLDMLIERRLVVELKAVRRILALHFVTMRSYLRAANVDLGLILNFSGVTLQVRRVPIQREF